MSSHDIDAFTLTVTMYAILKSLIRSLLGGGSCFPQRAEPKSSLAKVTIDSGPSNRASPDESIPDKPISVNYHFHRVCNYQCVICFHTAKSANFLPLDRAQEGLRRLKNEGMKKVTIKFRLRRS